MRSHFQIALNFAATIMLAACSVEKQSEASESSNNVEKQAVQEASKKPISTTASVKRGKASIRFGDDNFKLDLVICSGTSMATVVASDSARREGYPVVTIKTFDPALSGGVAQDTVLVLIERDGESEQWKMQNGDVAKNGNVFTAHGAFEGSRMVEQPDGTTKPERLEGNSYMPFHTRIECK